MSLSGESSERYSIATTRKPNRLLERLTLALFSCPSPFFLTLTLQAGRISRERKARVKSSGELSSSSLSMHMFESFLRDLWRPLDGGATLSDVGHADRQISA